MNVTISWHNQNPKTIWNCLKEKLGRDPTNAECKARVMEILQDGRIEKARVRSKNKWYKEER